MHAHITAFEVKLRLCEAQLANSQLDHFPRIAACVPDDVELDTCVSVVASLSEEFASRFAGIKPLAAHIWICKRMYTNCSILITCSNWAEHGETRNTTQFEVIGTGTD